MTTDHISDRRIKEKLMLPEWLTPVRGEKSVFERFRPDVCGKVAKNNHYICVEYENSSRGMVTHVAKYMYQAKHHSNIQYSVVLVETQKHQQKHTADTKLALNLIDLSSLDNVRFHRLLCCGNVDSLNVSLQQLLGAVIVINA